MPTRIQSGRLPVLIAVNEASPRRYTRTGDGFVFMPHARLAVIDLARLPIRAVERALKGGKEEDRSVRALIQLKGAQDSRIFRVEDAREALTSLRLPVPARRGDRKRWVHFVRDTAKEVLVTEGYRRLKNAKLVLWLDRRTNKVGPAVFCSDPEAAFIILSVFNYIFVCPCGVAFQQERTDQYYHDIPCREKFRKRNFRERHKRRESHQ